MVAKGAKHTEELVKEHGRSRAFMSLLAERAKELNIDF
jgi:hypothetical protein